MPKNISESERELLLRECQMMLSRFGVTFTIEDVISKNREGDNIFARALICFILKERGYILSQIGSVLGERGHATVINALKYGKEKKQGKWRYQKSYNEITESLKIEMSGQSIEETIKFHESELKRLNQFKERIKKTNQKKIQKNEQRKS